MGFGLRLLDSIQALSLPYRSIPLSLGNNTC